MKQLLFSKKSAREAVALLYALCADLELDLKDDSKKITAFTEKQLDNCETWLAKWDMNPKGAIMGK